MQVTQFRNHLGNLSVPNMTYTLTNQRHGKETIETPVYYIGKKILRPLVVKALNPFYSALKTMDHAISHFLSLPGAEAVSDPEWINKQRFRKYEKKIAKYQEEYVEIKKEMEKIQKRREGNYFKIPHPLGDLDILDLSNQSLFPNDENLIEEQKERLENLQNKIFKLTDKLNKEKSKEII